MKRFSLKPIFAVLVLCFVPMAVYSTDCNCNEFYEDVSIITENHPGLILEQDGPVDQIWAIRGNEGSFFINDVTHTNIPFRIEPNTPGDLFCMRSTGNVGIGTWSPYYSLEVEKTGINASIGIERVDGATGKLVAGQWGFQVGSVTNHPLKFIVNNTCVMTLNADGTLSMSDGGSYDGNWNPASSREYKENIRNLNPDEAAAALEGLNPVKFNYKKRKNEEHLGFIAEDVPGLVAMNERKNLSTMDIVAVLTKVVQQQQKSLEEHQEIISELKEKIADLEQK